MEMKDRILLVIKEKGLSKTAFAKSINLSQPFVSQLCSGVSLPSERTIRDICEKYNVNEFWLRTGEGEMFRQKTRAQEIADFAASLYENPTSFQAKLVTVLAKLEPEQWVLLEQKAEELFEEMQKEKAGQ